MSKDSERFSAPAMTVPDAPTWARTRALGLGCLLGALCGLVAMVFAGYRLGDPGSQRGSLWERIIKPAPEVTPIPLPLDLAGCRAGDRPPPLPRDGWIHGPAPQWQDFAGRVVVVDAWAAWCPYCGTVARELAAICREYERDGVIVVGVTSDDRQTAEDFCTQCGFSGLVACGAEEYLRSWLSDHYPTLLVIGRDGRVVWNDGAARLGHSTDELASELSQAIERAL